MILEDLDEECLWVNGVIGWKDERYERTFIRRGGRDQPGALGPLSADYGVKDS